MKPVLILLALVTSVLFVPFFTVSGKTLEVFPFQSNFLYRYDTINQTVTVAGRGYAESSPYLIPKHYPVSTGPFTVTAIADSAFYKDRDQLSGILQIPSTVTTIGKSAFEGNRLTSVSMDSVFSIGEYAFKNCESLTEIYSFNPEPPVCAENAFEGLLPYCNLYVPFGSAQKYREAEGWKQFSYIGEKAYAVVDGIKYRTIDEKSAEVVPDQMYYITGTIDNHLQFPKTVTIDNREFKVTQIGEDAFYKCWSFKKVMIHSGIAVIDDYAFGGCIIDSLIIEDGVKSIGNCAFGWCEWLTSVSLPGSIEYIGSAFYGCEELKEAVLDEGIQYIGNELFINCRRLSSVSLPAGIKGMGENCFTDCRSLKELTIGEGLAHIPNRLCYNSAVAKLYLPESVQSIGDEAFARCRSLSEITCMNPVPPKLGNEAFRDFNIAGCKLIVPEGSEDAYKRAEGWKEFWFDGTDINDGNLPGLSIKRNESGFEIGGTAYGEMIYVYDEGGTLLQSVTVTDEHTEITPKECGIYIIRYKGKGIKIVW